MRFQRFSGKLKKRSPILIRRVSGQSMVPTLRDGKIIIARTIFDDIKPSEFVIVTHDGIEKIKRVAKIKEGKIYIIGDNPQSSTDSRDFGWIKASSVVAKVMIF